MRVVRVLLEIFLSQAFLGCTLTYMYFSLKVSEEIGIDLMSLDLAERLRHPFYYSQVIAKHCQLYPENRLRRKVLAWGMAALLSLAALMLSFVYIAPSIGAGMFAICYPRL